jgi:hypothetical protein
VKSRRFVTSGHRAQPAREFGGTSFIIYLESSSRSFGLNFAPSQKGAVLCSLPRRTGLTLCGQGDFLLPKPFKGTILAPKPLGIWRMSESYRL